MFETGGFPATSIFHVPQRLAWARASPATDSCWNSPDLRRHRQTDGSGSAWIGCAANTRVQRGGLFTRRFLDADGRSASSSHRNLDRSFDYRPPAKQHPLSNDGSRHRTPGTRRAVDRCSPFWQEASRYLNALELSQTHSKVESPPISIGRVRNCSI